MMRTLAILAALTFPAPAAELYMVPSACVAVAKDRAAQLGVERPVIPRVITRARAERARAELDGMDDSPAVRRCRDAVARQWRF